MAVGGDGQSELDRVLGPLFNGRKGRVRPGVGGMDANGPGGVNAPGQIPGAAYAGGPDRSLTGPAGRISRKLSEKFDTLVGGLDLSKCGPLASEDCSELLSRLLEQTFRNFQIHARPPSHVAAPFRANPVVILPATGANVTLAAGAPGAFTDITALFTCPDSYRAEIQSFGQMAESDQAYNGIDWRILVDGVPLAIWTGNTNPTILQHHVFKFDPTPLPSPIHLRPGQTVRVDGRSTDGVAHAVRAVLMGWRYPLRADMGNDSAAGTIVD